MKDLIERQAAIDAVNSIDNLDAKVRGGICFKLMVLPSVTPDRCDTCRFVYYPKETNNDQ